MLYSARCKCFLMYLAEYTSIFACYNNVNSTKISAEGATPNSEGRKPWIYRRYLGCEV